MKTSYLIGKMMNEERVYCRYIVIDLHTGYALIYGEKWLNGATLARNYNFNGFFHTGWKRRIIGKFHREITIKGRECLIIYWAGAPVIKTGSVVSVAGCLVGLSGKIHENAGIPFRYRACLWVMGYRRKKVK